MHETKNFKLRTNSFSDDLRTNVWQVLCNKCGKWFSPPTTMMAVQLVECPNKKCDNSEIINYNELK
jgi:hypothetical protein